MPPEEYLNGKGKEYRNTPYLILILDKIVIKEQRCAIIVKGDNYGEEIRNQRRRIE